MTEPVPVTDPERLRRLALLGYLLQACAFVTGISLIAAVILAHLKREDAAGTWLESHFRWQIRSFWIWFGVMLVAVPALLVFIGWPLLLGVNFWFLYRVIKGGLYLSENRPLPGR